LRIAEENPDADKVSSSITPIPINRMNSIFQIVFYGGQHVIGNSGSIENHLIQVSDSNLGVLNTGEMTDIESMSAKILPANVSDEES
jgi:hypothetical protein